MDWTDWRKATCLPECWCEAARTGSWILEPVNTWTNLFFIFSGTPRLYGFSLMFLGAGSFFYDASKTFAGQWFDVFEIYLVSIFYIFYNFFRIEWIT